MLSKPNWWRTVRRSRSRSSSSVVFSCGDFERQAQALADQVGDHFDELGALVDQAVFRRFRLDGENALEVAADLDRHGDEGQIRLVEPLAVEKARLVGDARQLDGARLFQHQADDAFARAVLGVVEDRALRGVDGVDVEFAAVRVDDADQAARQAGLVVQHAQHVAQRFVEVQRTAEDAADGVERGEQQEVQLVRATVAAGGRAVVG